MDNLQGLVEHIRSMKRIKAFLMEGELLGVFSRRARDMNLRSWGEFWTLALESVKRSLRRSIQYLNNLFPTPQKDNLRAYCIQKKLFEVESQNFEVCPSLSRDPPKLFTHVPKTEIGGYARSDSLIRSLIF